jgi:hypothetical protein
MSTISAPGGTSVYIRQVPFGFDLYIEYSFDNNIWQKANWPVEVINTNPSEGMLKIEFIKNQIGNDITFSSLIGGTNGYFKCSSNNIQFGSTSLRDDGTRPKITIDSFTDYPGLIRNDSYSNIYVFNLEVITFSLFTSTTLANNAGWLCQANFGNAATNNYIINCYSDGEITQGSGGIVGAYAANGLNARLYTIGCSSSGIISGEGAGGIAGYNCGAHNGSINGPEISIQSCWTTGTISGLKSGGIIGNYAGYNGGKATITNCYSQGNITGTLTGGIIGYNPGYKGGSSFSVTNCYSEGDITGLSSGGICAGCELLADDINGTINNCYTSGDIKGEDDAGGILGYSITSGGSININISSCYTCGNISGSGEGGITGGTKTIPPNCYSAPGWNPSKANEYLLGVPTQAVGDTWVTIGLGFGYVLRNMGYSPYSTTNISGTNLVRLRSVNLTPGESSTSGIKTTGIFYAILQIGGGDSSSYSSITIDPSTGVISTTTSTAPGTYNLYLYNSGSYNISQVTFVVNNNGPSPKPTPTPSQIQVTVPEQRLGFNQKGGFCGTKSVTSTAVNVGAIRGKGSTTRILNNCTIRNKNTLELCILKSLGFK